jgi:signal peptide peptidase-like 2B
MNILFVQVVLILIKVHAIVPTGEILVENTESAQFCAPASWGKKLPQEYETIFRQMVIPSNGSSGCNPVVSDIKVVDEGFYLLVERGVCSFEHKARAAVSVGALGLIVYNSQSGVYQGRNFALPQDYECSNGQGWVTGALDAPIWDEKMTSKIPASCNEVSTCASKQCLFTNVTSDQGTQVCCAWDLYIGMGADQVEKPEDLETMLNKEIVEIPIVFVTMKTGAYLLNFLEGGNFMGVAIFARSLPPFDIASIIIWLMAMATIYYAADWISMKEIAHPESAKKMQDGVLTDDGDSSFSDVEAPGQNNDEESIDITPQSAFAFIGLASCTLILFFYVDLHLLILVIYVVGASLSISLVFVYPYILSAQKTSNAISPADNQGFIIQKKREETNPDFLFGVSLVVSALVSAVWFFNRSQCWSWLLQDFMGASVCLCFLNFIRLPNLQVATLLLAMAFVYDVFFVFITPFVFGSSVMVHVAQGGNKKIIVILI